MGRIKGTCAIIKFDGTWSSMSLYSEEDIDFLDWEALKKHFEPTLARCAKEDAIEFIDVCLIEVSKSPY